MIETYDHEHVEWQAGKGNLPMQDGTIVQVEDGDLIEGFMSPIGFVAVRVIKVRTIN